MPNPSQIQSKPFKGKTIAYISAVHGAKIKPSRLTSQGKLNTPNAALTRTGAISQYTRKPRRGPKNTRAVKKQHFGTSFPKVK